MESGAIQIIEQIQQDGAIQSLYLTEVVIAEWPDILFKQPIIQVELEYVVCPMHLLEELFQLTGIQRLILTGIATSEEAYENQQWIERLPDNIGNLRELKYADLFENRLKELPQTFNHLSNLRILDLGENNFTAESRLYLPPVLEQLDLFRNPLQEIPGDILKLNSLKALRLDHCKLGQVKLSADLNELQTVSLNYNPIKDLTIDPNSKLGVLHLVGCTLTDIPECLLKLSHVKELYLQHNELNQLPQDIAALQCLEKLNVSHNKITELPQSLGEAKNLILFNCSYNQIWQLPKTMGKLSQLETLIISSNKIQEFPSALYQMHQLKALSADNNVLSQIYPGIGQLKQLRSLSLHQCRLVFCTDDINDLENLEQLTLSHNWLKKLPRMDQLKQLKFLNVSGLHELESPDQEILRLLDLKNVREISLSYWKLSEIPLELKNLRHLKRINLGKIPAIRAKSQYWREKFHPIVLWIN